MIRSAFQILIASLLLSACQHDPELLPFAPSPPLPVDTIQVFSPCDTSHGGVAEAVKISAAWVAAAHCNPYLVNGKKYWTISLYTCSLEGDLREEITFSDIPQNNPIQLFSLQRHNSSLKENSLRSIYGVYSSDGDLVESVYEIDTLSSTDFLEIGTWDEINHWIEGRFRVSFKKIHYTWGGQPVPDYSNNPEQVKFWKGRFRLRLPE